MKTTLNKNKMESKANDCEKVHVIDELAKDMIEKTIYTICRNRQGFIDLTESPIAIGMDTDVIGVFLKGNTPYCIIVELISDGPNYLSTPLMNMSERYQILKHLMNLLFDTDYNTEENHQGNLGSMASVLMRCLITDSVKEDDNE